MTIGQRKAQGQKIFHVAMEGAKTEWQYLNVIANLNHHVRFKAVAKGHGKSPRQLQKAMRRYLEGGNVKPSDEAWIILDVNSWKRDHIRELIKFGRDNGVKIAISNPKFEYWILLHFEDGHKFQQSRLNASLKRHRAILHKKHINASQFTHDRVKMAITRASRKNPDNRDWPLAFPSSTVYKLVEAALNYRPR